MHIDFQLPDELIASEPAQKRDQCRLLVYDRKTNKIQHAKFNLIDSFLSPEYFLVLNQTRVNPNRIFWIDAKLKKQEIVFLRMLAEEMDSSTWEAIVSGTVKVGQEILIDPGFHFTLLKERVGGLALIKINKTRGTLDKMLAQKGQLPLPPYILKRRKEEGKPEYTSNDQRNYQTVFAKKNGAVAAPTAGLHFSTETFEKLKEKKIKWDFVNLAVGWGTFEPLNHFHFARKKLHPESMEISVKTTQNITLARESGKKILGVGTTSVRCLETWAAQGAPIANISQETELFIFPPYEFKMTDAILTNFHIPKSSLLLLVAAFLGENGAEKIQDIYAQAIELKYKFYSYGDCMLIL